MNGTWVHGHGAGLVHGGGGGVHGGGVGEAAAGVGAGVLRGHLPFGFYQNLAA